MSSSARIEGVDALRGLSAFAVLICHLVAYWTFLDLPHKVLALSQVGAHGVDVFVVLSGFCLALPLVDRSRELDVTAFFGRRALRIVPAYWVALVIAAVLAVLPATWSLMVTKPATLADVVAHAFGVQTIFTGTLGSINGSLWSVSLEMQLYLFFPLAILVWRRWGAAILLAGTLLLTVGWSLLGQAVEPSSGLLGSFLGDPHSVPARLGQFSIGIVTAGLLARRPESWTGRRTWGAAAIATLAATAGSTVNVPGWLDQLLWGLAGAVLIVAFSGRWHSPRALGGLEAFGRRSFSFYLLHQPIVLLSAVLFRHLPGGWAVQLLVGGFLVTIMVALCAEVLYRFVELPTHALGKRRFPRVVSSRKPLVEVA